MQLSAVLCSFLQRRRCKQASLLEARWFSQSNDQASSHVGVMSGNSLSAKDIASHRPSERNGFCALPVILAGSVLCYIPLCLLVLK